MKKTILGILALLVVGLVATGVNAYRGDYTVKGPYYDEDRHEDMEDAFENNDYDKWKELMTQEGRNSRVVEVITKDNFARFAQAHFEAENGNYEKASEIRNELGLFNGNGPKDGSGHGKGINSESRGMQRNSRNNFIDSDNDNICDNSGSGNFFRGRR